MVVIIVGVIYKMKGEKRIKQFYIMMKSALKTLINRFVMKSGAFAYLTKSKKIAKGGNIDEAIKVLVEGTNTYTHSYQLHAELVDLAMDKKNWGLAISHWDKLDVIKKGELKKYAYVRYGSALRSDKQTKRATEILTRGIASYPTDEKIKLELAYTFTDMKRWKKAAGLWDELLSKDNNKLPVITYSNASLAYREIGHDKKAEQALLKGIDLYPKNKRLLNEYANLAIYKRDWTSARQRLERIYSLHKEKTSMHVLIRAVMVNRMIGNNEQANYFLQLTLDIYPEKVKNDEKGYRKITLFDNGESRIEFYKKLQQTDTVVITFDSINMEWDSTPFAFQLLSKQNVDIIAIRKRREQTYQQDLSIEDFMETVNVLVSGYQDKIAYGFSLGAYAALYFASNLDCRILAIAPRLSIHPIYGRTKIIPTFEFKHQSSHNYNDKIAPIIVFDPMNALDYKYIHQELMNAFPNAKLVEVPYGGHGMAPHLLKMGVLKEFALTVISSREIPTYDRTLKSKSSIYLWQLGRACLNHNKLNWALDLTERSLALSPDDKDAVKLKIRTLIKMHQFEDALVYAKEAIKLVPEIIDIRILLIDLYIEKGDLIHAQKELNIVRKTLGKSYALSKRNKKIKSLVAK